MKEKEGIGKSPKIEEFSEELELRKGRIELAKFAGLMATAVGGASALIFSEDERVRIIGVTMLIGLTTYPVAQVGKQLLKDWRGEDFSNE